MKNKEVNLKNYKNFIFTICYLFFTLFLSLKYSSWFKIVVYESIILEIFGFLFLLVGLVFFIFVVIKVKNKKLILIKHDILLISRHPVYTILLVFIVPGIAFILNSWLFLTNSLIIYLIYLETIKRIEKIRELKYKDEYIKYKERVNKIIPVVKIKK